MNHYFKLSLPPFVFLTLLILLVGCLGKKDKAEKTSPHSTKSSQEKIISSVDPTIDTLANGQRLYHIRGCVKCHGTLGDGNGTKIYRYALDERPRDFQDFTSYKQGTNRSDLEHTIRVGITNGPSPMYSYPYLTDEEVQYIAIYVEFLQTNEVMRKPPK